DRLHRGPLDLDEAPPAQHAPERGEYAGPAEEGLHRLGIAEQVDVALAAALLDVGQAVPLLGGRHEALAEERQAAGFGEDRQIAGAGMAQRAVDAQQVAQVEPLGQGPAGLADLVLADHHLDLAGPVAELEEVDLPLASPEHDPARHPDAGAGLLGAL